MTNHIEVVASWDGNPLETTLHTQRAPLCIGPSGDAWFALPEALLAADHELVTLEDGRWILVAPEGAEVRVAKDGAVVASAGRVALEVGTTAEVRIGDFAFFVRPTEAVVDATPRSSRRYGWLRWMAVAAVLHALVLGIFAMSPPNVAALNAGERPDPTRYISVSVDAMASHDEPAVPVPSSTPADGAPSAPGGEPGGPTSSDRVAESGTPAPRRPGRPPSPAMSFSPLTSEDVSDFGAIAAIRALSWGDRPDSPFSSGNDHPGDGGLADAARLLTNPGDGVGPRGTDSTGVGTCNPLERDCTIGMIDTGDLTTHRPGNDPGWHPPTRGRRTPPQPGPTRTMGSLSREQVRRTVHRHLNEVRFCYEQGLQSRPELEGRVAVSFIISDSGVVQTSTVASDSTGSNQVSSCVSQAVRRWTFPSAAGSTGVTYPFVFQSN